MTITGPYNVLLLLVSLAATITTPATTAQRQQQSRGFVLAETRPSILKPKPPRFWPMLPQFKLPSTVYFDASRFATDDNGHAAVDESSRACDADAATSPEHDPITSDATPACLSLSPSSFQEPVQTELTHEENTPQTVVVVAAGTEEIQQHPSPQQQKQHEADENDDGNGHSMAAVVSAATATTSTPATATTTSTLGSFEKTNIAWKRAKVAIERVRHVRREVKAIFSSELECCLLKATRPENTAVDEGCMQALLAQANRLSALEASYDCDPHEVVCSKLLKKLMEPDWRTVAKALYVLHRLQRDSPPKEAARFSAFIKEKWADGAGELGKHIRTSGGKHAPWLKVYCGYLSTRGRRLENAMNAFRSWETLTSTRQLRKAMADTNALLARALALHFAADTSAAWGNGGGLRRACCELAFQDVSDVQRMVCRTKNPPALIGIPGIGEEEEEEDRLQSLPSDSSSVKSEADRPGSIFQQDSSGSSPREKYAGTESAEETAAAGGAERPPSASSDAVENAEVGEDEAGASATADGVTSVATNAVEPMEDEDEGMRTSAEQDVVKEENEIPEEILEIAKESAAYEDVSRVITTVYAARYGSDPAETDTSAIPTWMQQLAAMARTAGKRSETNSQASAAAGKGAAAVATAGEIQDSLRGGGGGGARGGGCWGWRRPKIVVQRRSSATGFVGGGVGVNADELEQRSKSAVSWRRRRLEAHGVDVEG